MALVIDMALNVRRCFRNDHSVREICYRAITAIPISYFDQMGEEQRSLVPYSNEWRLILKSGNEGSSVFYDESLRKLVVMPNNISNKVASSFETSTKEVIISGISSEQLI
jgi:hypothetical protein